MIQARLTPEAIAVSQDQDPMSVEQAEKLIADSSALPLGFKIGDNLYVLFFRLISDESLHGPATVLRLLYIQDLRFLQSRINALISTMQEYTAHPTAGTIVELSIFD